ncbi:MAG TPA: CPCC family cysteine-rich protein [Longimicrobium sp.]|nr:CPCC family cysteine-rich protein [Longimicrobium sp.]
MSAAAGDYPCPCCGYLVFDEPPGSYALCPVCDWEDDALQLEFATTLRGGANAGTLLEEQQRYLWPEWLRRRADYPRDPLWRPVDPETDVFEDFHDPRCIRPTSDAADALYYWRPSFWRR